MADQLTSITNAAVTPDQLIPYVAAVSGMRSTICGDCVLHIFENSGVLIGYPRNDPLNAEKMDKAVEMAARDFNLRELTVIGANIPVAAPASCEKKLDQYWFLKLPSSADNAKLRNMLKRAQKDVTVERSSQPDAWSDKHKNLASMFCERKKDGLEAGSIYIFNQLDAYLRSGADTVLYSARMADDRLVACAIADFTAFSTAFYMFAFRMPEAPPGCADLLLHALVEDAENRGYANINLGLGINKGVEFFKRKWRAEPGLPCVETSWKIPKKSFFSRLFAKGSQ